MKLSRFFIALVCVVISVAPGVGFTSPAAASVGVSPAPAPVRDASTTASRSAVRTELPVVVAQPPVVAPTTTAPPAPPVTVAPVTTTAAPKPKRVAATTTTTEAPAAVAEAAAAAVEGTGKEAVVSIARAQVGKAYRSAATGPNAFDCSGLVFYVFNQAGITVPRLTSDGYYAKSAHITRAELQPGDLIVGRGHIGIYVGDGMMVHASTPRGGVKLAPIDAPGKPIGYGRL